MKNAMHIGEAAARSGLPAKTIRYYEDCGLLLPAPRSGGGYRRYTANDLHMLRFVQRARSLGFSVTDCRELLDLYRDRRRASADIKAIARRRIADIDRKLAELASMRRALADLMDRCHGDARPDCPILDDLAAATNGDDRETRP